MVHHRTQIFYPTDTENTFSPACGTFANIDNTVSHKLRFKEPNNLLSYQTTEEEN